MSPVRAQVPTPPPPRYLCPQPFLLSPSCFEKGKTRHPKTNQQTLLNHHHCRILSALLASGQSHAFFIRIPTPQKPALQLPFPEQISMQARKKKKKGENCDMISKIPIQLSPYTWQLVRTAITPKKTLNNPKNPRSDLAGREISILVETRLSLGNLYISENGFS